MKQDGNEKLKIFISRFKNPMVITSIISQILIILTIAKVNVDTHAIGQIVIAVCSILVSLGVMNNPEKEKPVKVLKVKCQGCGDTCEYLLLNGELMVDEEGNPFEVSDDEIRMKNKSKILK